ncbi:MAG: hypothetical protein U0Z44_21775 [Kouleothrix sp.]
MNAEVIEQRDTALGSNRRPEAVVQALADLVEQLRAPTTSGASLGLAWVWPACSIGARGSAASRRFCNGTMCRCGICSSSA